MYLFVVSGFVTGGVWLFLERRPGSPAQAIVRLGVWSYGVFAILSGVFWVCWPQATVQLVPGHTGGALVATVAQARGLIVIALGALCIVERNPRRADGSSLLSSPAVYNLMMSSEALAAQFTELFTPQRWLYVSLHFLWAVCLTLRVRDELGSATRTAPDDAERSAGLRTGGWRPVLLTLAVLAGGFGLTLLAIPYDFQTPAQSPVASAFTAHATHGFGSGLVALATLALAIWQQRQRGLEKLGLVALVAVCFSLSILALMRASALGPLETVTRAVGFACILGAGALCLTFNQTRTNNRF